jgi:hypothetical protein
MCHYPLLKPPRTHRVNQDSAATDSGLRWYRTARGQISAERIANIVVIGHVHARNRGACPRAWPESVSNCCVRADVAPTSVTKHIHCPASVASTDATTAGVAPPTRRALATGLERSRPIQVPRARLGLEPRNRPMRHRERLCQRPGTHISLRGARSETRGRTAGN